MRNPGLQLAHVPFGDYVERGDLETALRDIGGFFLRLMQNSQVLGTDFPFPDFDAVCCEIGRRSGFELFGPASGPVDIPHDLVLITEACEQGGHAEIIRDLAEWNGHPLVVVATNLFDRAVPVMPELALHPNVLRTLDLKGTQLARLRGLQAILCNPAIQRVHVLCHANDSVAVAACGASDKPTLFFHHCDHGPCLGCFLPGAVHVDMHNLGFDRCGRQLGIAARYVCLTSRESTEPRGDGAYASPRFKTATCGSEHKLSRLAYPFGYRELLVRLIRAREGVHYHVGRLSDTYVASVRRALRDAGLPEESFVHVGHVSGFREIAAALEIDLYLPTLPQSGGKALVDVMCAGVPILAHENAIDRLWGSRDLIYPSAPSWSTLAEFEDALAWLDDEAIWRAQAAASLAHYQRYHGNTLFARQLAQSGLHDAPPPLAPYRPDIGLRIGLLGLQQALS
jgi:hypothetical protein